METVRRPSLGIRAKVILYALLCAVLPPAFISSLVITSWRDAIERSMRVELSSLAHEQLSRFTLSLDHAKTNLQTWSALDAMQDASSGDAEGSIQAELVSLRKNHSEFGELLVLNRSGVVVASTLRRNKGIGLKNEAFFSPGLEGNIFQGTLRPQRVTEGAGIAIAAPIYTRTNHNTNIGVLVGIIDWLSLERQLRAVRILGADQDADHKLILTTIAGSFSETPAPTLPKESGVEIVQVEGEEFLVATSVAPELKGSLLSGWVLHVMVSTEIAYADVTLIGTRLAVLAGALFAGVLALSTVGASRWIVKPIQRTTAIVREASLAKTDPDIGGNGKSDAIWELHRSISVLLDQHRSLLKREKVFRVKNLGFDAALTNMPQGLAMFDSNGRLVLCNKRLEELFSLPSVLCEAGTTLQQILEHLASTGLPEPSALFLRPQGIINDDGSAPDFFGTPDGRTIAIRHERMAGGGWLSVVEDVTQRRRAEERMTHLASHDPLTNLPNRTMLRSKIEDALRRANCAESFAVLCVDLDYFKNVNDTLGHAVGDTLLCAVGDRLQACLQENDLVARLGGDEFALVLTNTDQPSNATVLAQRLIEALSAEYEIDGHRIRIGASVGIAIAPRDGSNPDQIMRSADIALYCAKEGGRGRHRCFEPDMNRIHGRRNRLVDLRTAAANGPMSSAA